MKSEKTVPKVIMLDFKYRNVIIIPGIVNYQFSWNNIKKISKWFTQHTNNDWQKQSPASMIFLGNLGPNKNKIINYNYYRNYNVDLESPGNYVRIYDNANNYDPGIIV